MKLVGSSIEQKLREQLILSNGLLRRRQGLEHARLADVLESTNADVAGSYVLNWIPEQGEDIYVVLASAQEVLIVEIPRDEGGPLLRREAIARYREKCSRINRLKLAVAQELRSVAPPTTHYRTVTNGGRSDPQ